MEPMLEKGRAVGGKAFRTPRALQGEVGRKSGIKRKSVDPQERYKFG